MLGGLTGGPVRLSDIRAIFSYCPGVATEKSVAILAVEIFIEVYELYRLSPAFNVTVMKQICVISVLTGDVHIT